MFTNMSVEYPISLIISTGKKSFETLGNTIKKTGKAVSRLLSSSESNFLQLKSIAQQLFKNKKTLILVIDDSLIKKIYAKLMQGSGYFFDQKIGQSIMAFRLLCATITDGKHLIPLRCQFLYSVEFKDVAKQSKTEIVKGMITDAQKTFPEKTIIVAADGAFASIALLQWLLDNNIKAEMRMHSNRSVLYKGKSIIIRDIKELIPKGRNRACTISVLWHGMRLFITAQRRIDKHENETIVYQVATYKVKPSQHVANYKKRWPIEMLFRTCKQYLGLSDCFSRKMNVQLNHMSSVFVAYAFAQVERKIQKLKTPEEAIRWFKSKKVNFLKNRIAASSEIFGCFDA